MVVTLHPPRLVIVVRPAAGRRRLPEVLSWLRVLVPSALLLIAPASLPDLAGDRVIQFDCSDGPDGPLAVASQLARLLPR